MNTARSAPAIAATFDQQFGMVCGLKIQRECLGQLRPPSVSANGNRLGQNMLTIYADGGENILRVTPATEVIGTHKLEEKSREPKQIAL